MSGLIPLGD
ncbi:hypothetical protein Zm00014a_035167 [Zea mays]|uniref:Uncharacterized protein n=1 Tax=Zea mays TaxID=4577 RepID=A0A3L6EU30_MAIZE|nr:hypothetical protein Zm00014a_035167 [Zea mays]